jgi:ABC-type Mn2+/Zn2+ transport system ATPase subunit
MNDELVIRDLRVNVAGGEILKGLSLTVKSGEIHALMGPNGCGKSTLAITWRELTVDGAPMKPTGMTHRFEFIKDRDRSK